MTYPIVALVTSVRSLLTVVLTVLAVAAIGSALILGSHGWRLLSVQTGSMVPVFAPGDAVVMHPTNAKNLLVGVVISYHSPRDPAVTITHRLVDINNQTGWLTTQGDHLPSPDPSFPPRLLIGQVTAVAPLLGRLMNLVRQPVALAILVYIPAMALALVQLRHLKIALSPPAYRLYGYQDW